MATKSEINLDRYKRAISWIQQHTIDNHGIAVTSKQNIIYPEVTGYYIPTLIRFGYKDLALSYASYLVSIQQEDGSWQDPEGNASYIFDSGQILKGLVAAYPLKTDLKDNIIRGCDWLISRINEEGELVTPSKDAWGDDRKFCDEYIHLYCLEPMMKAGKLFDRPDYLEKAEKIKKFYIETYKDRILHFDLLSHFHAYVLEALVDIGEINLAREAMENVATFQKPDGSVPGLNRVQWICSTGLFQLAIAWFKLGDAERGKKAFDYACSLQNPSGGWYGSYSDIKWARELCLKRGMVHIFRTHTPYYFAKEEISWAVKYFLDAIYYMNKCLFDSDDETFEQMSIASIPEEDGRYKIIEKAAVDVGEGGGGS